MGIKWFAKLEKYMSKQKLIGIKITNKQQIVINRAYWTGINKIKKKLWNKWLANAIWWKWKSIKYCWWSLSHSWSKKQKIYFKLISD